MSKNLVHIVDDDVELINSIKWLLNTVEIASVAYTHPSEFINAIPNLASGCVLLDVRMPTLSGMEILNMLRTKQPSIPVIMMTAYGDVPMATNALKRGAVDFICKPFNQHALLELIQKTLNTTQYFTKMPVPLEESQKRIDALTSREREILSLISDGFTNKEIGSKLDIALATVEMHRSNIMRKMEADNLAQLIKQAVLLGL